MYAFVPDDRRQHMSCAYKHDVGGWHYVATVDFLNHSVTYTPSTGQASLLHGEPDPVTVYVNVYSGIIEQLDAISDLIPWMPGVEDLVNLCGQPA
jgi:hypothetical protein